jgi:hypothetical protein
MNKTLFWLPRILMILFIIFIGMLALDAFDGYETLIHKIGAFLIHLIPAYILIALLIVSWKRELIGGIAFFVLGVFYIVWAWGKFPLSVYFFISGPLFLISILFFLNWFKAKKNLHETMNLEF